MGIEVGEAVGIYVGAIVVGIKVGDAVGIEVGEAVGLYVGAIVVGI